MGRFPLAAVLLCLAAARPIPSGAQALEGLLQLTGAQEPAPVAQPSARPVSPAAILKERLSPPVVAAHQGGFFQHRGWFFLPPPLWPDTLPDFEKARQRGADIVEMDLRLTKDGVVVVNHDEAFRRFSWLVGCSGVIREMTLAEVRRCRYPDGSTPPTFEEVLRWSRGRVVVDAQFKDHESIGPAIALAEKQGALSWTYFQVQNNRRKYYEARRQSPDVALLYAVRTQDDLDWALSLKDEALLIIEVDERMRSPETIAAVHAAGKLVTEDSWRLGSRSYELFGSSSDCRKAYASGIDIPVTNRPKGCLKQRDARRRLPSDGN